MAPRSDGPFREEALERLSSPERLDQLLRVADRRSWLPLTALGLLIALLLAWSVVGRIPVYVHGRGVLVRPREFVELRAPGDGHLGGVTVAVGDRVEAGRVLARLTRADLSKRLELQRSKLEELLRQERLGSYQNARELAEQLRRRELASIVREREQLEQQWRMARTLPESLQSRLEARQRLHAEGVLSEEQRTAAEQDYVDSLARVSDLETRLRDLQTRELQTEQAYLDRLQRAADRESELADARREIARLETELSRQTAIVAEHAGRVLEWSASSGEYLEAGQRIGLLELSGPDAGFSSLCYFAVRDGKRLHPGMSIQVTPDTVERERYGGIRGEVLDVSPFPVTLAEVGKVVGSAELAATLTRDGHLMQVRAELLRDPDSASGFRWTSSGGPPTGFSAGTTTTSRVAVERRPPISFVLPFLRNVTGTD